MGGYLQTCEPQPDGTNRCWKDEEVAEADRAWGGSPGSAPDGNLKAMDSGQGFSCALWDGGHIGCWGSSSINDPPPPGIFGAVTVGGDHGCGLRPDGSIECWGEDTFGQASPINTLPLPKTRPEEHFEQISTKNRNKNIFVQSLLGWTKCRATKESEAEFEARMQSELNRILTTQRALHLQTRGLPPPSSVVNMRPGTPERRPGGLHAVYSIETPVARLNAAHTLPLAYLAHVADRLSHHLGADPGYTGLITRNPINPGPECFTHWGRMFPYTLGELDKALPKGKPPSRRQTGIGRNCDLFRSMVSEVFRPRWAPVLEAQGWSEAWLDHVRAQNVTMFAPDVLPDSECRSITKSCFRYWTRQYSQSRFRDLQTMRNGKRWHNDYDFDFELQAQNVRELKGWGLKQVTIAAIIGLSPSRISRILSQRL